MTLPSSVRRFWLRRLTILTGVVGRQTAILVVSAIVGFVLVRALPKPEYAWFTIATSMSVLLSSLGDSGLAAGLLAIGGRVHRDTDELSRLAITAMRMRLVLSGAAFVAVAPLSWYLLVRNGASHATAGLLVACAAAGAIPSATVGVLSYPLRLQAHYRPVQLAELGGAFSRLGASLLALLIAPTATLAIMAATIAQWVNGFSIRRVAARFLNLHAERKPEYQLALAKSVRALWFPMFVASVQPQVATWILGFLGMQSAVADLGAIGRFAIFFGLISTIISSLVSPVFARSNYRSELTSSFLQASAAVVLPCCGVTLVALVFPEPFLWVLGPAYSKLGVELFLFFLSGSILTFAALAWSFVSSRGWVGHAAIAAPVTLVLQSLALILLKVSTLRGVLLVTALSYVVPTIVHLVVAVRGLRQMPEETRAA